jgi:ADP-ribose pyrophosphatase
MPPTPWKTQSTREVYRNKWIRVREDIAEMPDGRTTIYGVCEMGHCVGILPFVSPTEVVMVRQYRYVQKEDSRWEMPTGGVHPGESLEDAAQRELAEEIGYHAATFEPISTFYTSKSVCDETAHLFIGRGLTPATAIPDDTEFIEIEIMPFSRVLDMVLAGEIRDAMTIIAVLYAARMEISHGK